MTGRVALVTGAARGIGAATVRALCAQQYRVVAVDSCRADVPSGVTYPLATAADLADTENAGHVVRFEADVRDRAGLDAAVEIAVQRFGRLDAVVAAAAVLVGGRPLWETPDEHLRTLWEVDVLGVANTAAACIPVMLSGPDPAACRFVAIASAAGERGLFRLAGYCMAKHAVIGLVRGLAADLAGHGMTTVAVAPGSTRTAMLAATADLYGVSPDALAGSLGDLIEPEEIAATIAFCCTPEGRVLNGSVVNADGGFRG